MEKVNVNQIIKAKAAGRKIAMLTAYDYPLAKLLDEAGIEIVLIGDSLGNVALGYRDTLPVTIEEMIIHTRAVARAVKRALVVADMPFGSFQNDPEAAVSNAVKLVKAGAEAVKIEGANYLPAIKQILRAGIPVMGHLGFTPQSVNLLGYRIQGRERAAAIKLFNDAQALAKAGCFAIVLELIPEALAGKISRALKIPTIGIGAGEKVDGQVLVTQDLLGLYERPPSFVKKYLDLNKLIRRAISKYIEELRSKRP